MNRRLTIATAVTVALLLGACTDDDDAATSTSSPTSAAATTAAAAGGGDSITLVTYESWPESMDEVLAEFTSQTGIGVEVVKAGDTGTMVQKAVLTAGNPEGDVMFGVDNTFLSEVVDGKVFDPYTAPGPGRSPEGAHWTGARRRGHAGRRR